LSQKHVDFLCLSPLHFFFGWHANLQRHSDKENDTLTLVFLLPPFDTPTWQCRPAWQRKRNKDGFLLTWFMFVFLQRVSFVICHRKMQGNLRGKSRSHFLIALINPACSKGERTEETTRFAFLFHCHLPFPLSPSFFGRQSTVTLVFSHSLLVWNIVGGFCMSASSMFNNRFFVRFLWLLVWMCCVFYVEESYIGVC